MKITNFFIWAVFCSLFYSSLLSARQIDIVDGPDYCYKPSKPLFFSTQSYKNRYAEDLEEYHRCKQGYSDMLENVAIIKKESDKNAQQIQDDYKRSLWMRND